MKTAITGLVSLCAFMACAAGAVPNPSLHAKDVAEAVKFATTTELCTLLGYQLDPLAGDKAMASVGDRAAKDGVTREVFNGMVDRAGMAINAWQLDEALELKARMDAASAAGNAKAISDEIETYIRTSDAECRSYANAPAFAALITAPADPTNVAGVAAVSGALLAGYKVGRKTQ